MIMRAAALLAFLCLLLPSPRLLGAEKKPLPPVEPVFFANGETLVVRVLDFHGTRMDLAYRGGKKLTLGTGDLAPGYVYHLRRRFLPGSTVKELHELAKFCKAKGLLAYAAREYARIAKIEPKLADVAKIWTRDLAIAPPDTMLAAMWDALMAKDYRKAKDRIIALGTAHPRHACTQKARPFLAFVRRMAHLGSPVLLEGLEPQTQKLVVYIEEKVEGTEAKLAKAQAFAKAGKVTQARDIFEGAEHTLVLGRKIYKESQAQCRTREGRIFLRQRRENLEARLVRLLVSSAEFYISLRSWKRAREKVATGLSLDKGSKRLRALAEHIRKNSKRRSLRGG